MSAVYTASLDNELTKLSFGFSIGEDDMRMAVQMGELNLSK
jgi:hypothetical protein